MSARRKAINRIVKNADRKDGMKFRDIIKIIENDGWYAVRQRGSHIQFRHKTKAGLVTIAPHSPNDDISPGTLSSIYKQAQIEKR